MTPGLVHAGLRVGFLVLVLALLPLPFVPPASAEFVISVFAALMAFVFLAGLVWVGSKRRREL